MNEELIVICNTPSKTKLAKFFPKPLIYVNYMRLHRDSLNSRSVVNARKRSLGACRSLPDQFSAQTLFDVFAKFHFQQLPKVTLTYIPLHSNPAGTSGTTIFLWSHCTVVVAIGRPDATEGPRSDISHMLHIMPLQNRNHSIVKY